MVKYNIMNNRINNKFKIKNKKILEKKTMKNL